MSRNLLRVITGAALAMTLVALALTLALQPPTGPGDFNTSLYECTVFLIRAELLLLVLFYACLLYCERSADDSDMKAVCRNSCLQWFIVAQFAIIVAYLTCILVTILAF